MECGLRSLRREMFIQKVHRLLVQSTLVPSDLLHSNYIQLATGSLVIAFYEPDLQTPDIPSSKSHVLLLLLLPPSSLSLYVVANNTFKSEALRNRPLQACPFFFRLLWGIPSPSQDRGLSFVHCSGIFNRYILSYRPYPAVVPSLLNQRTRHDMMRRDTPEHGVCCRHVFIIDETKTK